MTPVLQTRRIKAASHPLAVIWRRPVSSTFLLGTLGFLITFAGSWVPSPWLDEAATAHIIQYPVADMLQLWQHIDGIFGPYYLFIHYWVKLTGITPFWLQFPSMLAVGIGTGAMAATGRAVAGGRGQVLFALCFALLPRVTSMGIEARPYAISAAFTALALLAVVKLHRGKSGWYWAQLGLSMVGAVGAHLFSALPVIGLVLVAVVIFSNRGRLALIAVSAAAGLACLPLVMVGIRQKQQVAWIANAPFNVPNQALVEAWFPSRLDPRSDLVLASIAISLSILTALIVLAALVTGRRPLPKARLALAMVPPVVAVAALWIASLVSSPMVLGRYFTSSTPFLAMLLAECLMLLRPYAKQIAAFLLMAGCVVLIVTEREPYAKMPVNDYSFIAASIRSGAVAKDGLLIEPATVSTNTARSTKDLYPQDFAGLVDIAQPQKTPLNYPISVDAPVVNLAEQASLPSRVWLVTEIRQDSSYATQLAQLGYRPGSSSSGPAHSVALWVRG